MRYSMQREMILQAIRQSREHPTAECIYEQVTKVAPRISLGTVYRNIKQLCEQNQIISIETQDASVHYDGNCDAHRHFVCNRCNKIIDIFVSEDYPAEIKNQGLSVEAEKCVYYGLCSECNK